MDSHRDGQRVGNLKRGRAVEIAIVMAGNLEGWTTSSGHLGWLIGSLVGPQPGVGLPNGGSEYIPEVRKFRVR